MSAIEEYRVYPDEFDVNPVVCDNLQALDDESKIRLVEGKITVERLYMEQQDPAAVD